MILFVRLRHSAVHSQQIGRGVGALQGYPRARVPARAPLQQNKRDELLPTFQDLFLAVCTVIFHANPRRRVAGRGTLCGGKPILLSTLFFLLWLG